MKLEKEFSDLVKANAYIVTLNDAFTAEAAAKKAALDQTKLLQESLDQETEKGKKLSAERDKAIEAVTEISAKLSVYENNPGEGIIVSIGTKSYQLIGDSFIYDGQKRTAQELSKDSKELARMLKIKSGALVEVK